MAFALNDLVIGLGHFSKGPLSFSFDDPGIYLIEGLNGSGKTTLLKTLLGRAPKQAGKLKGLPAKIGTAGVEPLLMESWTVLENFRWLRDIADLDFNPELYERLKPLWNYKVSALSSGWRRQVELTHALQPEFRLVLLDEPFSFLDQKNKHHWMDEIKNTAEQGATILIAGHHKADYEDLGLTGVLSL